jgi:hypothetical protein
LLAGKNEAEPHHIRVAVQAARAIVDEAYSSEENDVARDVVASSWEGAPEQ